MTYLLTYDDDVHWTEARRVINHLLEFNPKLRPNLRRLLEASWFSGVTAAKQRLAKVDNF